MAADRRIYWIWHTMVRRCHNPQAGDYDRYGGRGIAVCEEWRHDFAAFQAWALEHGYAEGLQCDRIDNDGDYRPDNCRWVTAGENALNRSSCQRMELAGTTKTVTEWAEQLGLNRYTIYSWISRYGKRGAQARVYRRLAEMCEAS